MEKRKFLFLYLNTGAGHISAAKVLKQAVEKYESQAEVKMCVGIKKHGLAHIILEKGYNFSCNYVKGSFALIYELGKIRFFNSLVKVLLKPVIKGYLKKLILKEQPTDIVSFHFVLTPFVKEIVNELPFKIQFKTIVTDPFTTPSSWFYERTLSYFVFSQEAKDFAVKKCGIPEKKVTVVPFLMNNEAFRPVSAEKIQELKIKHGFNPQKRMVLLVGGGEGLPGATQIVNECVVAHRQDYEVAVICGRDKLKYENMKLLSLVNKRLHPYGFVNFLDELVKICDCAVIKAGPATLMEVLSCRKPVIICKYLHNQELGNMHFAINHKVGFFIQKPKKIYNKINELLLDSDFDSKMKQRFDSISIDTDASKIVKLLFQKQSV